MFVIKLIVVGVVVSECIILKGVVLSYVKV